MRRERGGIVLIGVILLANAVVILSGAEGQIEGVVGGVVCAVGGVLNVAVALRRGVTCNEDRTPPNRDARG